MSLGNNKKSIGFEIPLYNSKGGASVTPRTQAFLTATGITDGTIINALNTMDLALIAAGLLPSGTGAGILKAVYPIVGGTATTHKFNFVDPQDTNGAYRLSFSGGWTHSSTGALPNGINAYADSFLSPDTIGLNSNSAGFYSRTNNTSTSRDFGAGANFYPNIKFVDNNFYWQVNGGLDSLSLGALSSQGLFVINRTDASTSNGWRNKTKGTGTAGSSSASTDTIYLGARNNGGTPANYSNRECAFFFIGTGLTDTQENDLVDVIQTFQTSLGRQV